MLLTKSTVQRNGKTEQRKILTPLAISTIEKMEKEGRFSDRDGALEPPFMAPSTDPDRYSKVGGARYSSFVTYKLTPRSGARFATISGILWSYVPGAWSGSV